MPHSKESSRDRYRAGTDDPGTDLCDRLENLDRRHVIYQLEHLQLARANDLLMDAGALRYLLPDAVHAHVRELLSKHLDCTPGRTRHSPGRRSQASGGRQPLLTVAVHGDA